MPSKHISDKNGMEWNERKIQINIIRWLKRCHRKCKFIVYCCWSACNISEQPIDDFIAPRYSSTVYLLHLPQVNRPKLDSLRVKLNAKCFRIEILIDSLFLSTIWALWYHTSAYAPIHCTSIPVGEQLPPVSFKSNKNSMFHVRSLWPTL